MEFKIVESESESGQSFGWGEIARNMLNNFSQSVLVNSDEKLRRTVLLNGTRGNSIFPQYQTQDKALPVTQTTYLFMVNRSTELIG